VEPGIILKSNPAAAAGPEGLWPGGRASGPEGRRLGEPLARREQRGIISNGVNFGLKPIPQERKGRAE